MEQNARQSHLTAVGLGPGDPELVTVKGLRAIEAAGVIFVPRSREGDASLALRIARPWLDPARQRIVELELPMTRDPDLLAPAWRAAADQIADQLEAATRGAYLLLGDPLLYGTFIYVWSELAERYPQIAVTIIPGVTSFAAAAARAGIPLGTTNQRVSIVPASYETDAGQLRRLLSDAGTVILMKVGRVLPQVLTALAELGLLDSAIYAERIGMPEELIVRDLRTLQGQQRPYLSLLIVHPKAKGKRKSGRIAHGSELL